MLTNKELESIKERCEKATEGPWNYYHEDGVVTTSDPDACYAPEIVEEVGHGYNGEFIAHAREDIPKLLAEINELRNRLDEAEGLLEDASDLIDDMYPYETKTYGDITNYFAKNKPIEGGAE